MHTAIETERELANTKLVKIEWTERWRQEKSLRIRFQQLLCGALGTTALAIGGCVYLGSQPKQVVWPVFLDRATGRVLTGNPVQSGDKLSAGDWEQIKDGALRSFVEYWRSVSTDATFRKLYWDRAYEFIGRNSPASKFLDAWYRTHNPDLRQSKEVVTTRLISSGPVGESSYQVWWEESTSPLAGEPHTEQWRATFTYAVQANAKPQANSVNGFHVMITAISLSPVAINPEAQ